MTLRFPLHISIFYPLMVAVLFCSTPPPFVFAQCQSLGSGELYIKIDKCQELAKPEDLYLTKSREGQIKNMSPDLRKKFVESYQGLWVFGKVVRSLATGGELSPTKSYLFGKEISAFIPKSQFTCSKVNGKTAQVQMKEACCQGGIDLPCFLATSYVFTKVIDVFDDTKAPERKLETKTDPKVYEKAEAEFKKKKYAAAAKILLKEEGDKTTLDVRSYHLLAKSYRHLDLCPKAILVLRDKVYPKFLQKDYWGADETEVHDAVFLLSRCYAKSADGGRAIDILRGMMIEPERFGSYLRRSLREPDFGWIHTQPVYRKYKEDLAKLSPPIR